LLHFDPHAFPFDVAPLLKMRLNHMRHIIWLLKSKIQL
jgi:hypothetical protein